MLHCLKKQSTAQSGYRLTCTKKQQIFWQKFGSSLRHKRNLGTPLRQKCLGQRYLKNVPDSSAYLLKM